MLDTLPDRIADKIEPVTESGCWIWIGCVDSSGYGSVRDVDGARVRPHRLVYEHAVGPIPDGHVLMHKCDTRRCCNPDHLQPGTHVENMSDMVDKGRSHRAFGESNHQFRYGPCTRCKIRVMIATLSQSAIARRIGCSRATVQRAIA